MINYSVLFIVFFSLHNWRLIHQNLQVFIYCGNCNFFFPLWFDDGIDTEFVEKFSNFPDGETWIELRGLREKQWIFTKDWVGFQRFPVIRKRQSIRIKQQVGVHKETPLIKNFPRIFHDIRNSSASWHFQYFHPVTFYSSLQSNQFY